MVDNRIVCASPEGAVALCDAKLAVEFTVPRPASLGQGFRVHSVFHLSPHAVGVAFVWEADESQAVTHSLDLNQRSWSSCGDVCHDSETIGKV